MDVRVNEKINNNNKINKHKLIFSSIKQQQI